MKWEWVDCPFADSQALIRVGGDVNNDEDYILYSSEWLTVSEPAKKLIAAAPDLWSVLIDLCTATGPDWDTANKLIGSLAERES